MIALCYIPQRQMKLDIAGWFCGVENPSAMAGRLGLMPKNSWRAPGEENSTPEIANGAITQLFYYVCDLSGPLTDRFAFGLLESLLFLPLITALAAIKRCNQGMVVPEHR